MKITETVNSLVSKTVEELGFELVDVEFKKEQTNWVLTLFIDSPKGITLDDCERVSRAVEPIIDDADPIEQSYFLSVSSLGLDRPIKKDKDFIRNINKKAIVKLYAPLNGEKEYQGVLLDFNEDSFTLEISDKSGTLVIRRKDAAMIKPYIEF